MPEHASRGRRESQRDAGLARGPALEAALAGRLAPIEWFMSTWQRGGSATGFSTWTHDDGSALDVMVKLPVPETEYEWTVRLGQVEPGAWHTPEAHARCTPRVRAHGVGIPPLSTAQSDPENGDAGEPCRWLVMERLPGRPLHNDLSPRDGEDMLRAAAAFHEHAQRAQPVDDSPARWDWDGLLERSRRVLEDTEIPARTRWKAGVKAAHKALPTLVKRWRQRPIDTWCHGDLHPRNAMRRAAHDGSPGPCVLLDLACVHAGNWIEDALYLERQFWGHADHLHGTKPVPTLKKHRKALGLPCDPASGELANVKRVLMAACVPAFRGTEGGQVYESAALDVLERTLEPALR